MDPTNSYFAAAGGSTGLKDGLDELLEIRQKLFSGSPSRSKLIGRSSNVITPQTGAAKYWYVDPAAQQRAVLPDTQRLPEGIGLLPPNAKNILKRNILGKAPRLASERDDLLREIDTTIYGAPAPTPTPTPQTRMMPISFFT